jgi:hypothetical protein
MKTPTLHELQAVWRKILENPEAVGALARLKRDGFPISRRALNEHPSWASHIASIPFLPNRDSRPRLHRGKSLRKHMSLVNFLREFAAETNVNFCEIRIRRGNEILLKDSREFSAELSQAADLIEKLISSNWSVRHQNPRNTVIASLRWTIRDRTGSPHDLELANLIDAAREAAGKQPIYLGPQRLARMERLELEGRGKAASRLEFVSGKSTSPSFDKSLLTRFPRNRKKLD